ncbi:MAG: ABC transporter ATP-binding protein [Myxococcales bacterium]|nr:ABC transporter ATP-binding protein [Myxococcales bacterium]
MNDLLIEVDVPGLGYCAAVDGVSFEVHRGETLALVGESGCGKSLTLLSVLGLLPRGAIQSGGELAWEGTLLDSPAAFSELRGKSIGFVPQDPLSSLNPVMRVGRHVTEVLGRHQGLSGRAAEKAATELLTRVGLRDAARRLSAYPHELSGGERQRVLIAAALAGDPELLVADEPTTALDVTVQAQVLTLFRELQAARALGIVLVTHDLGVVARAADRVAVLYAGTVVETGPVALVLESPRHPYTRALLDAAPGFLDAPGSPFGVPEAARGLEAAVFETDQRARRARRLKAIGGAVPRPGQVPVGCRFRDRCPRAEPRCVREEPSLSADEHGVACHVPLDGPALGGVR